MNKKSSQRYCDLMLCSIEERMDFVNSDVDRANVKAKYLTFCTRLTEYKCNNNEETIGAITKDIELVESGLCKLIDIAHPNAKFVAWDKITEAYNKDEEVKALTVVEQIESLIEKQPKSESLDCYDDHGLYYDEGFYEGYVEALTTVLKIIEKESIK